MTFEPDVCHLLGLHMHQPPGNLELLIHANEWEAGQIMLCYERPVRYAQRYRDVARVCVGFSGILPEQFQDPNIVRRYSGIVDIPKMLEGYRDAANIEFAGMGYYHPVFPLIPSEDWEEQIARGKQKIIEVFDREPKIFWPPEMAFTMEMIPVLARCGYEYVVVDSVHGAAKEPLRREEVVYQTHVAEYGGAKITVIPRDRDLSNAQQSGLNPAWFEGEVSHKTAAARKPCLVVTWTDGENGGWFRQTHEESGFWGYFFAPYMERVRTHQTPLRPVPVSDFVAQKPPRSQVAVRTGAWNVGSTSGYDFSQWAGSASQKRAVEEIFRLRRTHKELGESLTAEQKAAAAGKLDRARELILKAETSCHLFWGETWIPKLYEYTHVAHQLLEEVATSEKGAGR